MLKKHIGKIDKDVVPTFDKIILVDEAMPGNGQRQGFPVKKIRLQKALQPRCCQINLFVRRAIQLELLGDQRAGVDHTLNEGNLFLFVVEKHENLAQESSLIGET